MEVKSCFLCEPFTTPTTTLAVKQYLPFFTVRFRPNQNQNASIHTPKKYQFQQLIRNYGSEIIITGSTTSEPPSTTKRRTITRKKTKTKTKSKTILESPAPLELENSAKQTQQQPAIAQKGKSVRGLYQNGDPLGRRDLGKSVVNWIGQGMKAMASDFALAELQGEFMEVRQRMEPGLTFVIQAQPYLNAIPMPVGLEAVCLKASTHYPTLFDHFQRELRDVLQASQRKSLLQNWRESESWKLLKELANSGDLEYEVSRFNLFL